MLDAQKRDILTSIRIIGPGVSGQNGQFTINMQQAMTSSNMSATAKCNDDGTVTITFN